MYVSVRHCDSHDVFRGCIHISVNFKLEHHGTEIVKTHEI